MGVEAAMGQADLFHDVGDARAVVPAAPGSARGGPDDPFVGDLLAAWPGSAGGSAHMMIIKYQSNAECKKATPRAIGEEVYSHLGQVRHRSEVVEYRVEQHAAKLGLVLAIGSLALTPTPSWAQFSGLFLRAEATGLAYFDLTQVQGAVEGT